MLDVADLHTYYGESHVLQGVSLTVGRGEVVSILGRNGMGKTTLIRSIIGFTPARRGTVRFKGADITPWPPFRAVALGMGLVPQGRRVFPSLTVRENLEVARRAPRDPAPGVTPRPQHGASEAGPPRSDPTTPSSLQWTLERVYAMFPRLSERARNRANKLSGGEQQMLAIGRALMTNPDLLLMDEPTEGLAPLLVREVGHAIDALKREGLSILLVEQNLPLALSVADRVHVLSRGQIVHSCSPAELAADDTVKARYLGV